MPFVAMQLKSDGLYADIFESPDLAAQDLTDLTVLLKKTVLFSCTFLFASYELYDASGFDPHRQTVSSIPNEPIDPFTGGLILSFVNIRLPGNGGSDLVIQGTLSRSGLT